MRTSGDTGFWIDGSANAPHTILHSSLRVQESRNAVINIFKASDSMLENTASALQGLTHNVASPPRDTTKVFDLKIYLYLSQHLWRSKPSTLPSLPTGLIFQKGS